MEIDKLVLQEIGLTKWEISLYLTLLRLGTAKKKEIIQKADIPASKLYEVADKLLKRGLLSSTKVNGITHFSAVSPNRVVQLLEAKQKELYDHTQKLSDTIIKNKTISGFVESEVFVFKGYKGMINAYNATLNSLPNGGAIYVISDHFENMSKGKETIFLNFMKKLSEKKIRLKLLLDEKSKKWFEKIKTKLGEVRYLPSKQKNNCFVSSWKDCLVYSIITEEPLIVYIKNKQAADAFQNHFKILWKK